MNVAARASSAAPPRHAAAVAGFVALLVGLAITGTLAARGGWERFIDHDAVYFAAVAQDLDASEADGGSAAYRYGRVGLPVLTRLLSFGGIGSAAAQALVTPLSLGVLVWAAVSVSGAARRPWQTGLAVLLVPGLWVGFLSAWADTLLAALVLVAMWATLDDRPRLVAPVAALAILTKEIGALVAAPALVAGAVGRRWQLALSAAAAAVPAVLWWGWVRAQAGEWPFRAEETAQATAVPLADIITALTGGRGSAWAAVYALVVGSIGLAVVVRRWREPLAWSAAIWGALTLCLGDNVLAYPGDTLRVTTPAACVIALAVAVLWRPTGPAAAVATRTSVDRG